ncbi:unnamed protein product [Candida verbasci]|uniref:GIY-YIG domain-containing protein n=1 Tax=Candida verbasci TaxID=1227364 RepID=A0A9W4U0S3_9ASCO|nr:unnamed protein product [Candida verbasci]
MSHKQSTYIGSTPDIKKRLRQHNGELTGGAYKTKKKRPWRVILIVYGFTSKISALQFEHSLQHSYQTRLIDEKISKKGGRSVHKLLGNVKMLLDSFHRLQVCIFDNEAKEIWDMNKYNINSVITPELINFDEFDMGEIELLHIPERVCIICKEAVGDKFGICNDHVFHFGCLAKKSTLLIPDTIDCVCGETIIWKEMVKQSLYTINHEIEQQKKRNGSISSIQTKTAQSQIKTTQALFVEEESSQKKHTTASQLLLEEEVSQNRSRSNLQSLFVQDSSQ